MMYPLIKKYNINNFNLCHLFSMTTNQIEDCGVNTKTGTQDKILSHTFKSEANT